LICLASAARRACLGDLGEVDPLAASIEALRIERGIERWHMVGHDAGCAIAVECAHRYPHRVGRLALLTPFIFPDLKPFPLFEVLRKPVVGEVMAPAENLLFWKLVMRVARRGHQHQQ
jgi:pimeloyl-ACP methyl ester carboxylesterase